MLKKLLVKPFSVYSFRKITHNKFHILNLFLLFQIAFKAYSFITTKKFYMTKKYKHTIKKLLLFYHKLSAY